MTKNAHDRDPNEYNHEQEAHHLSGDGESPFPQLLSDECSFYVWSISIWVARHRSQSTHPDSLPQSDCASWTRFANDLRKTYN
jgi:hypothetical protein